MRNSKSGLAWGILSLILFSLCVFGCSSNDAGTNNDDNGGGLTADGHTVTFQASAPGGAASNGRSVRASIWLHWNDSLPMTYGDAVVSNGAASVELDSIGSGTYTVLVSIDSTGDGLTVDSPIEEGGYFFGAFNVVINADRTITVSGDYWQHMEPGSVLIGVDGIPAGHDGQPVGTGLFADGEGVLTYPLPQSLGGGVGLIWNNSALVALHMEQGQQEQGSAAVLPNGPYDFIAIIDADGSLDDWNTEEYNPISDGDLVDYQDITVDAEHPLEGLIKMSLTPEAVSVNTFTFFSPVSADADGKPLYIAVLDEFGSEPVMRLDGVVTGEEASAEATIWTPGTYTLVAFIDMDNSGLETSPDAGDLVWGALDIDMTGDQAVSLPAGSWATFQEGAQLFLVSDIPDGNNARPVTLGIYEDDRVPMDLHQQPQFAGLARVYNNSAVVVASATHAHENPSNVLPNGSYDVWVVIDHDGMKSDYNDSTFVTFTPGDPYVKYDLTRNEPNLEEMKIIAMPTAYETTRGITGTVSCPAYTSGEIYLYCFYENPLAGGDTPTQSSVRLSSPGAYTMPMLANDSVFVLGFWDADNSGEYEGPNPGDLLGGYGIGEGGSTDDLIKVHTSAMQASNIDFTLWMDMGPQAPAFGR